MSEVSFLLSVWLYDDGLLHLSVACGVFFVLSLIHLIHHHDPFFGIGEIDEGLQRITTTITLFICGFETKRSHPLR